MDVGMRRHDKWFAAPLKHVPSRIALRYTTPMQISLRVPLATFLLAFLIPTIQADELRHDSPILTVQLGPRTPEQIAAFYEARGFQADMIEVLRQQCYLTVFIHNKSQDILWLDLQHWEFSNADGPVARLDRHHWRQRWQAMEIPLAHQSTFRWTLLPEQLDFLPGEREGGNLILPRLDKPLRIQARFDTGADRAGPPVQLVFDRVECAVNP
ncbi:MAG: hypothetical protein OQK27_05905 [Gammaproteobacteria bacterium]|nr:hypothetical protein [Gammaproteobacteria bacterium]MCW9057581.1 hypothetical protein [Gammaproteobacteria bacterium]